MARLSLLSDSPAARRTWAAVRLATSAALFAAIVAQLVRTAQYAGERDQHLLTVMTNHLSYFTVLATTAGAITLLLGGIWLRRHADDGADEPRWLSLLFLMVIAAVVITGVVYNVLLRGESAADSDTVAWASEIKHTLAPVVFLLDAVLRLGRTHLRPRDVVVSLAVPVIWVVYTLLRGEHITDPATGEPWWYPYGFINPHRTGGAVALYVVGIAAAFAGLAALIVWWSRRARR